MNKKMNKNNFTKYEIEILKKHYKQELIEAEKKVKEIKLSISNLVELRKVESTSISESLRNNIKLSSTFEREKKSKIKVIHPNKKLSPVNIGWTNLIIDTLRSKKTLLPSKAFMEIVENKYKINEEQKKKARSNITGCLSDLTKKYNRLVRYGVHGEKKGLYGLAEWFDSKGKLQAIYKQNLLNV